MKTIDLVKPIGWTLVAVMVGFMIASVLEALDYTLRLLVR